MRKLSITSVIVFLFSASFSLASLNDGLVAHWNFNEGAGSTLGESINGLNGTIHGATWTQGVAGSALSFDGSNDYVEMQVPNTLKIDLPFTFSAWVKVHARSTKQQYIIVNDDSVSQYLGAVVSIMPSGVLGIGYNDGGPGTSSDRRSKIGNTSLNLDTWYHIAVIMSGPTNMHTFINGVEDSGYYTGSGDGIAYSPYGSAYIGTSNPGIGTLNGLIDDLRMYDRVLTSQEIAQLAIPEPCTMILFLTGAAALASNKRK
jgi:hypothetical protein